MPDDTPSTTIPQLVDAAAARFGGDDAIVEDHERWSFVELATRVHEVARALISSGIEPGDRVGLWAPNIREWIVAAMGVYTAGACLVPVNTRFKGREARYVLDKAQARLVFTVTDFLDGDYVDALRADGGVDSVEEIVVLRGPVPSGAVSFADFLARAESVDDAVRAERSAAVRGDDICHILFTSGTTGAPKGAMLSHEQVCRAYLVFAEVIGLRPGDRYLIVLPFFHSFGLHAGILCCLMKGAAIYPLLVFEPAATMRRIEEEGITAFPGAPAMYQAILNDPGVESFDASSLRLAILGAAVIPVELIEGMRGRLGLECVVTGYGITEGSGIVTMCRYDDPPEVVAHTSGRALPGVEVRLVGDDGKEVPADDPGEILVRGYTLMRGYLDDPEQTAEAIDPDGWLHTGDIGVLRADGNLMITDRKKDMYVVGGFNAYPAEIENVMLSHPAVGQVAVVGTPDARLGEVGVAFVIPRPGVAADPNEIIEWCRREMANYKVPRVVEIVDELPLNASGKVLKYELRERAAGATGRRLTSSTIGEVTALQRFEGRVALVTGAASGIGRAVCRRLAAEGATLVGADVDAERLELVAHEIGAEGGRFVGRTVDIGERSACRAVVEECVRVNGRLDVLGNVAGISRAEHFPDVTEEQYRRMTAVNVDGAFFLSQAAIPHLLTTKGSIINVASNAGLQGVAYLVVYSMTKGAIVNLTKSMAMEYAKTDVRINAIAPGGTNTRLSETFATPPDVDPELMRAMLGFRGANEPEEVAAFFAFVASDESRGIHGAILPIDRGVTTG